MSIPSSRKKSKFNPLFRSYSVATKMSIDRESKLKDIFGENIINTINTFEQIHLETKNYLNDLTEKINEKYKNFNEEINNHIDSTANKYIKAFGLEESTDSKNDNEKNLIIQKNSKNYIDMLQKIISLHDQILGTIKENISVLINFLEISKILDKEKPTQEFLTEEFNNIVNSWMFLKLDFEKFNFMKALNNSKVSLNMKEFISKIYNAQNMLMSIGESKWKTRINQSIKNKNDEEDNSFKSKKLRGSKMLKENSNNFMKLKIMNINNMHNYFNDDLHFTQTKSLIIENSSPISDNFLFNFPNLEKLKIKYCPSLDINLMINLSNNITKLYLTNNNFVDSDFKSIMSNYLIKNKNIRNSLKILSFANNEITKADFDMLFNSPKEIFRELKQIDLHKNRLYKLNFDPEHFPELKFINCSRNNFDHFYYKTLKNIIVMQSANDFLCDKELYTEYYTNLEQILNDNNSFPINYLNISYLPSIYSNKYLSELNISNSISINLKKLDLSYNKLRTESFLKFAKNNKSCLNIKVLNLNGNEFDDTFFEVFLQKGIKNIFSKLQHLYLSNNKIGIDNICVNYKDNNPISDGNYEKDINKLRLLYKFIVENRNLTKLNITKNPIKDKLKIVMESGGASNFNEKYIKRDEDDNIIINCFFSFLIKIKNELLSKEDYKIERKEFVVVFDCKNSLNLNSETYPYKNFPIVFNKSEKN